jgi:hypothetical protein
MVGIDGIAPEILYWLARRYDFEYNNFKTAKHNIRAFTEFHLISNLNLWTPTPFCYSIIISVIPSLIQI